MSDYRRWYVPGGTYFFTVVTYRRRKLFDQQLARDLLGKAMRTIGEELPCETVAIVLLPDHLHAVWTLPPGDTDYSIRWKKIKDEFTTTWLAAGGTELPVTPAQARRGHRGVWQKRFWEHTIRDEEDLENHCDYAHYNPVKHGYVQRPWDWPFSSFRRFVQLGHYPWDWGRREPLNIGGMDFE